MKMTLIKSPPAGDFAEVSALMKDWEATLEALASQRRPIRYDHYPLREVSGQIRERLKQLGYVELVLENDRWQHFLIPDGN